MCTGIWTEICCNNLNLLLQLYEVVVSRKMVQALDLALETEGSSLECYLSCMHHKLYRNSVLQKFQMLSPFQQLSRTLSI